MKKRKKELSCHRHHRFHSYFLLDCARNTAPEPQEYKHFLQEIWPQTSLPNSLPNQCGLSSHLTKGNLFCCFQCECTKRVCVDTKRVNAHIHWDLPASQACVLPQTAILALLDCIPPTLDQGTIIFFKDFFLKFLTSLVDIIKMAYGPKKVVKIV